MKGYIEEYEVHMKYTSVIKVYDSYLVYLCLR